MVLRVKILVLTLLLLVSVKLLAQDEIFVSGFEPVPELFLDASPEIISMGESTTITWSVIDADSCVKLGDWSGVATAGTGIYNEVVIPASLPAIYSMQCNNIYGNSPIRTVIIEEEAVNPPTLTFDANPSTLLAGDSTVLTWTVNNANSCSASVLSGNVIGWSGNVSSSNGTHSRVVTVNVLPSNLNLTCENNAGAVSNIVNLTESTNVPPTLNFTINGFNSVVIITLGDPLNIAWSTSGASSCVATSSPMVPGWNGARLTNGFQTISGLNESSTFSMTCSNPFGSVIKTVIVQVHELPCELTSPPPAGTFRYMGETVFEQTLGSEFGDFTNDYASYSQPNSSFSALEFNAPSNTIDGRVQFLEPSILHPDAWVTTAKISLCPGDFETNAVTGNCQEEYFSNGAIHWTTDQSASPAFYCILEPNKKYFLNIIHAPSIDLGVDSCDDLNGCGVLFNQAE